MARIAKIIFEYGGDDPVSGYTVKPYDTVAEAILDTTGSGTGLSVNYSALPSRINNNTYSAGDRHGYTQAVIQETGLYTSTSFDVDITGSLTGEKITSIKMWGCSLATGADRQSDYTSSGTTLTHDNSDGGLAAPVEFTDEITTFPHSITVAKASGASFGYLSIMEITLTEVSSATITNIDGDNNVQVGQTGAIITTTGIDAASVTQSVTLGGETLTINSWS